MARLRDPWSGDVVEVGEGVSEAKRLKILLDGGFDIVPDAGVARPTGAAAADSSPPETAEAPAVTHSHAGAPHPSKTAKKVKK